jgi:hypothetical protein
MVSIQVNPDIALLICSGGAFVFGLLFLISGIRIFRKQKYYSISVAQGGIGYRSPQRIIGKAARRDGIISTSMGTAALLLGIILLVISIRNMIS